MAQRLSMNMVAIDSNYIRANTLFSFLRSANKTNRGVASKNLQNVGDEVS